MLQPGTPQLEELLSLHPLLLLRRAHRHRARSHNNNNISVTGLVSSDCVMPGRCFASDAVSLIGVLFPARLVCGLFFDHGGSGVFDRIVIVVLALLISIVNNTCSWNSLHLVLVRRGPFDVLILEQSQY